MSAPQPQLFRAKDGKHVFVFSGQDFFNGWLCQWSDGPHSALIPLKQLDKVPLPPGFDVVDAIRRGKVLPRVEAAA